MRLFSILAALCPILMLAPASAHHSTSGIYHDDQIVEITGTIKDWRFINPHPYLTIDVTAEDGSINEWDVSFGGAAVVHLEGRGYTAETFRPGDVIIVRGHPARATGVYGLLVEGEDPRWEDGTPVVP